ncbi:hypothetical protein [Acaryochloris thomasi]|nr:hypothetical protein [Acaryochloris thomasi]
MATSREEELRQRELELKERELEVRLRELDADVQRSTSKEPEVQEPADYAETKLEDARPGRSFRRRWRRAITISKFVGLAVVSIAAVSVAFWLGLIVIFGALAYTLFQVFFTKD